MTEISLTHKAIAYLQAQKAYYSDFLKGMPKRIQLTELIFNSLIDDAPWTIQEASENEVIVREEWYVEYQAASIGTGKRERLEMTPILEERSDEYEKRICRKLTEMILAS